MDSAAKLLVGIGLVVALVGACAPTTPAPTSAQEHHGAEQDAGSAPEVADVDDEDGEVETSNELAIRAASPCPTNMVLVANGDVRFCIDRYEASLVEVDSDGSEKPFPHWLPVDGHAVRAVSEPAVFPQGFVSEVQAEDACAASGKRLCTYGEWKTACMGPAKTTFPYGDARKPGACHDTGKSAVGAVFGTRAMTDPVASAPAPVKRSANAQASRGTTNANGPTAKNAKPNRKTHVTTKGRAAETTRPRAVRAAHKPEKSERTAGREKNEKTPARATKRITAKASSRPASVEPSVWTQLNDPRLGQVEGALAKTGTHDTCVNGYGVLDMVGNLHEWVKTDPASPHGTFAGGYYLDTALNGDGCQYRTTAHAHDYHDYSTGFRCCAEPGTTDRKSPAEN